MHACEGHANFPASDLSKHKEKGIHGEKYTYAVTNLGEQGNWGALRYRRGWTWTVVDQLWVLTDLDDDKCVCERIC